MLAILRGVDELGVRAKFVLLYPNEGYDRLDESLYKNIAIEYLWHKRKCHNKFYKFLVSFIDARNFAKKLKNGEIVVLFGSSTYISFFTSIQGVRVYQERTEHPQINPAEFTFLQKCYLKCVPRLDGMFVMSKGLQRLSKETSGFETEFLDYSWDSITNSYIKLFLS